MSFLRKRSALCGETYSFSIGKLLGATTDDDVFTVISIGPECLSSNLEELKEKELDFPKPLGELAEHFLSGPDVYKIYNVANIPQKMDHYSNGKILPDGF
ncbi:hypothetical protein BT96DRAFT_993967 [Gymnopus androsaceus JB14]|uniref:Uncharacterized protein n=1 Tax=Gymnopus androsaceus JB14 TaxID=1447944 RepID=A0A6A4HR45_9AGAR|nr:hypothetical protein BT96DRAFT_993967 [Gymnopus androsaceus JB14]